MRPIDATLIKVPLQVHNKLEAIGQLLDLLVAQGLVTDREKVMAELIEREKESSTAIGDGAAIPHARSDCVKDAVCAFGSTLGEEIDFGTSPGLGHGNGNGASHAVAREPSNGNGGTRSASMFFLMISPRQDTALHIKTLARIARVVKDERRRTSLRQASRVDEILELLGDLARV